MSLREYLERRENQLLGELTKLYADIKEREAELAEIRRAYVAVGAPIPSPAADEALLRSTTVEQWDEIQRTSLYRDLTMKQLVVRALLDHFEGGATASQLVDFFRDAWGRGILRTNLSPQLSRLAAEGVIERRDGKRWLLTTAGRVETQMKKIGHWPEKAKWNPEGDRGE